MTRTGRMCPCGTIAGPWGLCAAHTREVEQRIRDRRVSSQEFEEIRQRCYERLLGPKGASTYRPSERPFLYWLREAVRTVIKRYFEENRRARLREVPDHAALPGRAQDPESERLLTAFLVRARKSYIAEGDGRFDRGKFFDVAVYEHEALWVNELDEAAYRHLSTLFPRSDPQHGEDERRESDRYDYLRQRVRTLRAHARSLNAERARPTDVQRPTKMRRGTE
jgi:hypothetical protein